MRLKFSINQILSQLWQVFLPNVCQLCGMSGPDLVCSACCREWLHQDQPRCRRCANLLLAATKDAATCGACLSRPPAFSLTTVLGDYAAPQDRLIWALKFGNRLVLAQFFAGHLARAIKQETDTTYPFPPPSLLIPIPLSQLRLRQRGYNQAWEVAKRLGRLCQIPARADGLIKVHDTRRQAELPLVQRHKNLRGTFIAQTCVAGLHIGLVDDVMTSGATLEAAARALLGAGALSVRNYVLLRTPLH